MKTVVYFDHTALMSGGESALLHLLQHLDTRRIRPVVVLRYVCRLFATQMAGSRNLRR
jgi:hypothetical protein